MTWSVAFSVQPANMGVLGAVARRHCQKITALCNLSGPALRLELGNPGGVNPLEFASVTVRTSATQKPALVTLGGKASFSVPAGQASYSDPVWLRVAAGDTLYIETVSADDCPVHDFDVLYQDIPVSVQAHGAFTAAHGMEEALEGIMNLDGASILYGVYGVQVLCEKTPALITFFGDSITQMGYWTGPFSQKLFSEMPAETGVTNRGISGNRLLRPTAVHPLVRKDSFGAAGVRRFERDIFAGSIPSVVFLMEGANDICHPYGLDMPDERVTAEQLIDGLETCARIARAYGAKIIGCTILPYKGYKDWNEEGEAVRLETNRRMRQSAAFDAVIDTSAFVADPANPQAIDSRLHRGDCLHPNAAGGKRIADCIAPRHLPGLE